MQPWLTDTYTQHQRGLYALALSITRRGELAEDAVHDAVVKLARLRTPPPADPAAYLFTAVRHAAFDLRQRTARLGAAGAPDDIPPLPAAGAGPERSAEKAEERRLLMAALDRLAEEAREVIVLRTWAGLSFQQIADTLGEPLGSVATRYYRAIADLRRLLDADSPANPSRHASA